VRTIGKYRLLEPLASGGMADVWRAEVTLAAGVVKEVALKLVRGEHEARSDFVRMFVEEARLAARLTHANVVQVFEFDEIDGRYFLAMELVHGRHLGRVVDRAREMGLRLGLPRAVHLGAEAAKALAYVHRLSEGGRPMGLVHRDVSPHNVLVSFEGEVKLADFGIARAMSFAGLTEPGTLKGKLAYMAPEQARGEAVDARADVFALGVILWELCAGRRLFARDSDAATLAALLDGPNPSPPSAWNEAVPPALDALVLACLERTAARRIGTADEVAAGLAGHLLRLARSPDDWDLRAFMRRLWPDGATSLPPAQLEPTRVQPGAAAPVSPPSAMLPAAPDPVSAVTRTVGSGGGVRARRRRALQAAGLVAAGALSVGALLLWHAARVPAPAGGTPEVSAALTPAPVAPTEGVVPSSAAGGPASTAAGVQGSLVRLETQTAAARPETQTAPPPEEAAAPPPGAGGGDAPVGVARVNVETSNTEAAREDVAGSIPERSGTLHVNALPWGNVAVDGRAVGETPVTVALAPGRHRIRVTHPSFGARETAVTISSGRETSWTPNLMK
jgi:serine/threonine-protein kinase